MNPSFSIFHDKNQIQDSTCIQRNKGRRRKRKHIPHAKRSAEFVENRNRRERERVQGLKAAFDELRKHVPYCDHDDRVSKVDILLAATDYIHGMREMIQKYDHNIRKSFRSNQDLLPVDYVQRNSQWTEHKSENLGIRTLHPTRTSCDEIHMNNFTPSAFQSIDLFTPESTYDEEQDYRISTNRQHGYLCNLTNKNSYHATNNACSANFSRYMAYNNSFVSQDQNHRCFPAFQSDNCHFCNQSYPSLTKTKYCQQIEYNIL